VLGVKPLGTPHLSRVDLKTETEYILRNVVFVNELCVPAGVRLLLIEAGSRCRNNGLKSIVQWKRARMCEGVRRHREVEDGVVRARSIGK
jgi:hypothetical protein